MKLKVAALLFVAAAITSCKSSKYAVTNKSYKKQVKTYSAMFTQMPPVTPGQDSLQMATEWAGTVNMSLRKPNYVIIHHTAQNSIDATIKTFTVTHSAVSIHYAIAKDGTIHHMLNDYLKAWHAGLSKWGNTIDMNSVSIGIELDNNGFEVFTEPQLISLMKLLGNLKANYAIPTPNFIGHADIAPKRKPDPNQNFPWKRFAEKGFGLWYDEVLEAAPETFDAMIGLRIIGYDISKPESAFVEFKRHFIQTDLTPVLTQHDRDVLFNLYKKYL